MLSYYNLITDIEAIAQLFRIDPSDRIVGVAVAGIPDDTRGGRLEALYVHGTLSPAEIYERMAASDLPRLWIPQRENFYAIEALPQLGTGKLDARRTFTRAGADRRGRLTALEPSS